MNCACYQARRFPSRSASCEGCAWAPTWRWAYVDRRPVLRAWRRGDVWFSLDLSPARRMMNARQQAWLERCAGSDGVVLAGSDFVDGRVPPSTWAQVLAQLEAVVAAAEPVPPPARQNVEGVRDG